MAFSLFESLNIVDAPFTSFLNTGSMLDFQTGQFVPGEHGSTILNGGLSMTNAFLGRPQVFKSTTANGMLVNALARYPHSEAYIFDTEFSLKDKRRITQMSDLYRDDPIKREAHLKDLDNRIRLTDPSMFDLETFFAEVKKIADKKLAHLKECTVTIPILDPRSGKPMTMLIPTFIVIDSWSKAKIKAAMDLLEQHSASDSGTNMVFMREGLGKNKILSQVPALAAKAGLYFILTAHIGDQFVMNPLLPTPKEIQHMKQGDTTKGVGSDFMFLVSNVVEIRSPKVLITKDKEPQYPYPTGLTVPTEMSTTNTIITRCKNNASGSQFAPVLSQTRGYEAQLSNLDYLKENDYYGLGTNKVNVKPTLQPDVSFTRKSAIEKLTDYKTARAIELLAQLCYVQNNWSILDANVPFDISPEKFAEDLTKSSYAIEDILNTRGWWTYGPQERSYLSLYDALAITTGVYKPKLISVKA